MSRRFPFPIPFGWFGVAYSDELRPGEIRSLHYFDRELALYRTESGEAHLIDAFCPHLGAHLGDGAVKGENIVCPFHNWAFDTRGWVAEIPYCEQMPGRAERGPATRVYPVTELNQVIYAWYHPEDKSPMWEPERLEQANSDDWGPLIKYEWRLRTCVQDPGENVADPAHFLYVHGTKSLPESVVEYEGLEYYSCQNADMQTPKGLVKGQIEMRGRGPGGGRTVFSGICDTFLMVNTTPIDVDHTHIRLAFSKKKIDAEVPEGGVADAIIADIVKQLNEDAPIWERKGYVEKPLLCANDGPIMKFRRWFSQFYADETA